VLLAVKAQDTATAVRALLPHLTPESAVVSFQNGLNEETIAGIVGAERTIGCFVNFSADYLEPGVITYAGKAEVYLGELDGRLTPRLEALQEGLAAWGPVQFTDNILGYLWGKEAYGNMLFATALADETMADVLDRYRALMVELGTEVFAVADREGLRVEAIDGVDPALFYPPQNRDPGALHRAFDALVATRRANLKTKSGIWRDLAVRHRKTELDSELQIVEIGERYGLPLPLTRRVIDMIRDIEDGRRVMSWDNLEELDELRRSLNLPHPLD
jgi:2-dehydropantoate 2-reductase